jgi:hypothetical protein
VRLITDSDAATWEQFDLGDVVLTGGPRFLLYGMNHQLTSAQTYADGASMTSWLTPGAQRA